MVSLAQAEGTFLDSPPQWRLVERNSVITTSHKSIITQRTSSQPCDLAPSSILQSQTTGKCGEEIDHNDEEEEDGKFSTWSSASTGSTRKYSRPIAEFDRESSQINTSAITAPSVHSGGVGPGGGHAGSAALLGTNYAYHSQQADRRNSHTPSHHEMGDRRPSSRSHHTNTMQRSPSSADISTYTCGEGSRKLQIASNLILLIVSLVMIGTGSGLMGFYRLHMLEVVTIEFLVVPLLLVVGGVFTFLTAVFGFYVTMKEDSCLMITYAVFMALEFFLIMAGIVASVRLIFTIQTGLFNTDVVPELNYYETDAWIRYKWDTLQREYACCGGYGYTLGYQDWKHTVLGMQHNSVPDSCCLYEAQSCGKNVFIMTDPKKIFQTINTHGCITIMQRRLDTHVIVILIVYCVVGGVLGIMQLLSVVLACCFANQIAKLEGDEWEYDYGNPTFGGGAGGTRPPTPQTLMSNELTSHHETVF